MGYENAKNFVDKMFNDEAFLTEVCHHGGFEDGADDERKTQLILKASSEMGYEFSGADYEQAMTAYFEGKGPFAAIKAFAHLNKVIKKANRGR